MKEKCGWVVESLPLFLDGELKADEAERVERHLRACESCRREAHALDESWKMFRESQPRANLPVELYKNPFREPRLRLSVWLRPLLVGAVLGAVALLVEFRPGRRPAPAPEPPSQLLPVLSQEKLAKPPAAVLEAQRAGEARRLQPLPKGSSGGVALSVDREWAPLEAAPHWKDDGSGLNVVPYRARENAGRREYEG